MTSASDKQHTDLGKLSHQGRGFPVHASRIHSLCSTLTSTTPLRTCGLDFVGNAHERTYSPRPKGRVTLRIETQQQRAAPSLPSSFRPQLPSRPPRRPLPPHTSAEPAPRSRPYRSTRAPQQPGTPAAPGTHPPGGSGSARGCQQQDEGHGRSDGHSRAGPVRGARRSEQPAPGGAPAAAFVAAAEAGPGPAQPRYGPGRLGEVTEREKRLRQPRPHLSTSVRRIRFRLGSGSEVVLVLFAA